jgi:2-keto-4-pentenoate hydratase/2-oxohepta-3-ene-1,7-dioic acid hydratase in catechol pathway
MKIARFCRGGTPQLAVVVHDRLIPVPAAIAGDDPAGWLSSWPSLRAEIEQYLASDPESIPLAEARLLAPVPRPGKVLAIGLNYADHIAESGLPWPQTQVWFTKTGNCVHAPFDPIQIPRVSDKVDYEVELVAIIGKRGRHISADEAAGHIFGYCVGNDVSVRDWQLATAQWMIGKSFDTHGPFGPWITTADEIADPHALAIACHVNGELRQSSNTRHLVFNLWQQIEHLSAAMTLEPGDVIFTGTPNGVGWAMQPQQTLKPGDIVRCEVERLGAIEARFELER